MSQPDLPEIKLDTDNLYREDVFTDRKAGTLQIGRASCRERV